MFAIEADAELESTRIIGQSVPRKEGREKVTGNARYIDDLSFPGMLYGATVRSPAARGRIRGIHFEGTLPWSEFTIVTAKDIPSHNCGRPDYRRPALPCRRLRESSRGTDRLLLAHSDKYLLEEARRSVRIEIEPLPGIFTIQDSVAQKEIIWGQDNVFKAFNVEKGNVDVAWERADFIVEGEYQTGAQEQLCCTLSRTG